METNLKSTEPMCNPKIARLNAMPGTLDKTIYDCKKCLNRGFMYSLKEYMGTEVEVAVECECITKRAAILRMKKSGLEPIIKRCSFDTYNATEEWQKAIKNKALTFLKDLDNLPNKWFYIGGGIGSGKTHICTAIVKELLEKGKNARYMLWVNDSTKLKACVNDAEYEPMLDEYRKAEVLYIDDFFKIVKDNMGHPLNPSSADLRLAYEIINYRYQHDELITIISSERYAGEIEEIDSAIGSRILEKCLENAISVGREPNRNYRLKSIKIL